MGMVTFTMQRQKEEAEQKEKDQKAAKLEADTKASDEAKPAKRKRRSKTNGVSN